MFPRGRTGEAAPRPGRRPGEHGPPRRERRQRRSRWPCREEPDEEGGLQRDRGAGRPVRRGAQRAGHRRARRVLGGAGRSCRGCRTPAGSWTDDTALPYNSDDPRYRDIDSNSSGGAGLVTGRITGLAADDDGYVYAGAANGGVWRSTTGGGHWQPISDKLPAPSTGDLRLDGRGRLWYATGEANTSATSFVGTGVYVLRDPRHGHVQPGDRVGGTELESTIDPQAAVRRQHRVGGHQPGRVDPLHHEPVAAPWKLEFAPNPDYLPGGPLADDPNAPYKNIANDVAIDPKNPSKVILAVGWRSGDDYNGFYTKQDGTWQRITLAGDIAERRRRTSAPSPSRRSADGSTLLRDRPVAGAADHQPGQRPGGHLRLQVRLAVRPVDAGRRLPEAGRLRLGADRSGLHAGHPGLVQPVPPGRPEPTRSTCTLGLEEVFETKDGGAHLDHARAVLELRLPLLEHRPVASRPVTATRPPTPTSTRSRSAATTASPYVFVGNDGGVYKRPVTAQADAVRARHRLDVTQRRHHRHPAVLLGGRRHGPAAGGLAITGGLQDNGQSILRAGDKVMGSNFGGDGGDTSSTRPTAATSPQEYVYLAMSVTKNCAVNDGSWIDRPGARPPVATSPRRTTTTARPASSPRSPPTPRTARPGSPAAGTSGSRPTATPSAAATSGPTPSTSAPGTSPPPSPVSGGKVYVGWCGPCNNQGFTRGIAVGNADGTGWHQLDPAGRRAPCPTATSPASPSTRDNPDHVYVAVNGFSRHWTEGPGAGVGHVFESRDGGATWKDISANLPDVPANAVRSVWGGGLVARHRPRRGLPRAGPHRLAVARSQPADHGRPADQDRPARAAALRRHPRPRHLVLRPWQLLFG